MEIVFSCSLSQAEEDLALSSKIYQNWLTSLDPLIKVQEVDIQSVDFIGRETKKVLFMKMKTKAFNPNGKQIPGIVLLRGSAVCILPVLYTEDEPYIVLVGQARIGTGHLALLEVPAGILDVNMDLRELAAKELQEETGLIAPPEDLVDMLAQNHSEHETLYTSVGISDETLGFYLYERSMRPNDFEDLQGQLRSLEDENEYIKVEMLPLSAAKKHIRDSKSLLAILLYESLKWSNGA